MSLFVGWDEGGEMTGIATSGWIAQTGAVGRWYSGTLDAQGVEDCEWC